MNVQKLTSMLAECVMGWRVTADRFMVGKRDWIPRHRFQPATRIEDSFRLLERASPEACTMGFGERGTFWVKLLIRGNSGEACEHSKPLALTLAVARALKIDVAS